MPSIKGKEKATSVKADDVIEDSNSHGTTVFVSSLAFNTTSASLEEAFSDLAPVRNTFVVTQKDGDGEAKSKGVGFVSFAIQEDADQVMSKYKEGTGVPFKIDGRSVRIQWAKKKPSPTERSPKKETASSAPKTSSSVPITPLKKSKSKPAAGASLVNDAPDVLSRAIVISALPTDMTKKILWKRLRKLTGAESCDFPLSGRPHAARGVFADDENAREARERLDGSTFHGTTIHVKMADGSDGSVGKSKSSRLIIRNLPSKITDADLKKLFSPYGTVHYVKVPPGKERVPGGKVLPPRFAFIQMDSKVHAEKAIRGVNGKTVRPGLVKEEDADADGDVKMDGVTSSSSGEGKVVAVDFALPKDAWEARQTDKAEMEVDAKLEDEAEDEEDEAEDEEEDEEQENDESGEDSQEEAGSEEDGDEDMDSEDDDARNVRTEPEEGSTLFIRNLAFEATDEDLHGVFRVFGPLRYACVTMDHATGRSRGTGFACYWKRKDADKAVEEAERVKRDTTVRMKEKSSAAPSFSLLTVDPSSSVAAKLVLMGRILDVTRAVTRDQAGNLKEAAQKIREKKQDGRNLYLLREGVILQNSPAAQSLPAAALATRIKSYDQRREQLRTNPALYVSQTRLSIRNLPRWVSERGLKKMASHAIKAFEQEVKEESRKGVSHDEEEVDEELAGPPGEKKKSTKKKYSGPVKQSKISRHKTQVDPLHPGGLGRSEGFGFLEMEKHTDALRVLRWVNNRPGVVELLWGWWKEELKELVDKAKKGGEDEEEGEKDEGAKARLKLWEEALEQDSQVKDRPLLVEFSIENKVVTKRRLEKQTKSQAKAKEPVASETTGVKRKNLLEFGAQDEEDDDDKRAKKPPKRSKTAEESHSAEHKGPRMIAGRGGRGGRGGRSRGAPRGRGGRGRGMSTRGRV